MLKRAFDLILATFGLVLLSPVIAVIAILIKVFAPGPALYAATRVGRFGRPFRLYKFRTMVLNADKIGGPSTPDDDPRVTGIGRILRRYKLDELPQLVNVVKGDMSFVGPRPEVPAEVALYTPEEREVLNVVPGITDWASMKFHNEGEILKGSADPHRTYQEEIRPEKLRLGLKYVHDRSLWVDLQILFGTLSLLLKTRMKSEATQ
jgi:lipopolysaccharide/colanic/teichoic acid biosynthesis glycosyltransferase